MTMDDEGGVTAQGSMTMDNDSGEVAKTPMTMGHVGCVTSECSMTMDDEGGNPAGGGVVGKTPACLVAASLSRNVQPNWAR